MLLKRGPPIVLHWLWSETPTVSQKPCKITKKASPVFLLTVSVIRRYSSHNDSDKDQTTSQSKAGDLRTVSRVWDMASNWPFVIAWFKYRLALPCVAMHCGLTWSMGISTVSRLIVSLHSPNDRKASQRRLWMNLDKDRTLVWLRTGEMWGVSS